MEAVPGFRIHWVPGLRSPTRGEASRVEIPPAYTIVIPIAPAISSLCRSYILRLCVVLVLEALCFFLVIASWLVRDVCRSSISSAGCSMAGLQPVGRMTHAPVVWGRFAPSERRRRAGFACSDIGGRICSDVLRDRWLTVASAVGLLRLADEHGARSLRAEAGPTSPAVCLCVSEGRAAIGARQRALAAVWGQGPVAFASVRPGSPCRAIQGTGRARSCACAVVGGLSPTATP